MSFELRPSGRPVALWSPLQPRSFLASSRSFSDPWLLPRGFICKHLGISQTSSGCGLVIEVGCVWRPRSGRRQRCLAHLLAPKDVPRVQAGSPEGWSVPAGGRGRPGSGAWAVCGRLVCPPLCRHPERSGSSSVVVQWPRSPGAAQLLPRVFRDSGARRACVFVTVTDPGRTGLQTSTASSTAGGCDVHAAPCAAVASAPAPIPAACVDTEQ